MKKDRDDLIKEKEALLKQSLEGRDFNFLDVLIDAVKDKSSLERINLLHQIIVTFQSKN